MSIQLLRAAVLPLVSALALAGPALSDDPIFSGPQPGEKLTPVRALAVTGPEAGKEIDPVSAAGGAPTVLVFLHGLERSMVPLLTTLDQYGAEKAPGLRTQFVALSDDRVAAEQRLPLVAQSLRLKSPLVLSLDGPEGPGNYGLNKQCLMTVVMGRENRVTANFALVQPGIADAPRVLAKLAELVGDPQPPMAEALQSRRGTPERGAGRRTETPPADLSRLDLNTQEGLREAVRVLAAEVRSLREEVQRLRQERGAPGAGSARPAGGELPGAAPTDPRLVQLLRAFIQRTNDPAAVDRVVAEVESYVRDDAALRKQAVDGWTRVLHLKYGTEYAHKAGAELLERLRR
ncbi:MAG: hypothetical protein ACK47B_18530 [Armatimonadota bacterium]